jgi:hypothetical protein
MKDLKHKDLFLIFLIVMLVLSLNLSHFNFGFVPEVKANPDSDTKQVGQDTDDATVYDTNYDGTVDVISPTHTYPKLGLYSGGYYGQPFRTTGWNIPSAALITHAYIYMTSRSTLTGDVNLEVKGEEANGATFSDLTNYLARTRTTASASWDMSGSWSSGVERCSSDYSCDVKDVIQEVLDDSGVGTLTDIVLFVEDMDTDSESCYYVHSYDSSSGNAPRLYVEWTTGQNYIVDLTMTISKNQSININWNATNLLTQSFPITWNVLIQSTNIIDLSQPFSAVWNVLVQSTFNIGSTVTISATEKTMWETDSFNDESKIAGKWQVYVDTGNGWVRLEDSP